MVFLRRLGLLMVFSFISVKGNAQALSPLRVKLFKVFSDTIVLDSLSLVPGSVKLKTYPQGDSTLAPVIDYKSHSLIFRGKKPDSIAVAYKRFPYNFEKLFFHKDPDILYTDLSRRANPFTIRYNSQSQENLFQNDGLNKNGNISRGISFGNTQDITVNSNLNLQVSGKLTPEIDLVLAATDNNIPFQADGTTAQLQEFDKVFIQLSNYNTKMIVGDYQLSRPQNSYFMNFYKRAQGLYLENSYRDSSAKTPLTFKTQVSGAVSRGKFSRQVFFGVESNQGPYRLRGANNEPFIIVLSGTEKIYIDGKLLQRGQENDYIIDYNTGELTFTARQLITKDKRIVAEFQYAERNYARSLFFFGEEVESKKTKIFLNFFSEQDNKNRSLQQKLDSAQKRVLFNVGDSLDEALYTGVTREGFTDAKIFYRKTDTLVGAGLFRNVYVYSTDPDTARYTLQFSDVGAGNGNYSQVNSAANGKVYVWQSPVNGQRRGNYEPVIPLVAPRQQQMLTGGFSSSLTADNIIQTEGVYTKNNINTFSSKDKGNDEGSGVKVSSRNQWVFRTDSLKRETKLVYHVNYEFLQQRFTQVERFRGIEFDRDWNRPLSGVLLNDQHVAGAEVGLLKTSSRGLTYAYHIFEEGGNYEGRRHNVAGNYQDRAVNLAYAGAYLNTSDKGNAQATGFYRHTSLASRKINRLKFTYSDVFENNLFKKAFNGGLLPRTYQFWEWEGSVANADSSKNNAKIFYRERRDKLAYSGGLKDSTFATNIGLQASVYSIKNNPITLLVTYRKLELKKNVVGASLKPDNTLLNRLEYNPRYFKGFITAGVFYETGYGLENKREFYYLEVVPGQGQYAWIDYNTNGTKELNEFETAQFGDQARYIRIYTPTNQYMKVLQNQVSVSLNVRPSSVLSRSMSQMARFANRWVFQAAIRVDNKITDEKNISNFNPLAVVRDSFLLATNNNKRYSVFFNQSSAVFGADYTYTDNKSKQLLTNGLEGKTLLSNEIKWRVNFLRSWAVNSTNTLSRKSNTSQFFISRNYLIEAVETEQRLIFQPNTVFRIAGIYKYSEKKNKVKEASQVAFLNTLAMELKYNQTDKGSLTSRVDFVRIRYNDGENSSVGYEMLNGLARGDNFTWELTYQRNLNSNIQVSINYNGRKTPNAPVVHLGGAQVRAFF